jgi:hypothetical protein
VLEALNCSLALSRRPSGVALLGVTDGRPTLAAYLLPRSMGIAVAGNRLAIATSREFPVLIQSEPASRLCVDAFSRREPLSTPAIQVRGRLSRENATILYSHG